MLSNALLDISTPLNQQEKRFYGCIKLVSDATRPVVFYINNIWLDEYIVSIHNNVITDHIKKYPQNSHKLMSKLMQHLAKDATASSAKHPLLPRLVYMEDGSWEISNKIREKLDVKTIGSDFVLSPSPISNHAALLEQGLTANTAILCLAAVGVDILLPNISVDLFADEEIAAIREKYQTERMEYLNAISKIAQTAHSGLTSKDFGEVIAWAKNEIAFSVAPKAREFEIALAKHTKKSLKNAGYSLWKDGVPAIGAAYFSGGILPAISMASAQALQSIVTSISNVTESVSIPEVSYIMKIRKSHAD